MVSLADRTICTIGTLQTVENSAFTEMATAVDQIVSALAVVAGGNIRAV
jgi:hypothetical protein